MSEVRVMKLDTRAFALSCALIWGGALLLVGLMNLIWAGYGQAFLEGIGSIYIGYHATRSIVEVLLLTVYATVDGFVGGAVLGWLYNRLAK
jgi:hypothetical protein